MVLLICAQFSCIREFMNILNLMQHNHIHNTPSYYNPSLAVRTWHKLPYSLFIGSNNSNI